jgi:hypothetical protein
MWGSRGRVHHAWQVLWIGFPFRADNTMGMVPSGSEPRHQSVYSMLLGRGNESMSRKQQLLQAWRVAFASS